MATALIVLVIAGVILYKLVTGIIHWADRNIGALILLKWLIGHHHGRTNATFFHAGTKITHPSGKASKWSHKPGYYRMGVRWGCLGVIGGSLYGYYTQRTLTEIALIIAMLALVAFGQWKGYRAVKLRSHTRGTLNPLRTAVAEQLNMSDKAAIHSVSLRPDYATVTESDAWLGTIVLPDNWRPEQEESMRALLESRLGSNIDLSFRTARAPFTVQITRTPQPPAIAHLPQYLDRIAELPADKVMLGIDGRAKPVSWDIEHENPHMFTVAPSRRGKTRLLLLIVSQILSQGGSTLVIDPKRVGVRDVLGSHPCVTVYSDHRDIELMWKGIHEARMLVDDRIDQWDNGVRDFKRHIVAIDEISLFSEMSRTAWELLRTPQDSKIPPVWADIKAIAYAGAQFRVNLVVFGQAINERVLPNMVGQFGTRLMSGYSKRDYDRLVGTTPVIPSPKLRGRFLFYDGGNPQMIQTLLGTDDELRDLAFKSVDTAETVIAGKVVSVPEIAA